MAYQNLSVLYGAIGKLELALQYMRMASRLKQAEIGNKLGDGELVQK